MIAGVHTTNVSGAGLLNVAATPFAVGSSASSKAADSPFGELLTDVIGKVSELDDQAHNAIKGLLTGSGIDIHQAMIASEKASMAFEMALAVRNKAIQSYQSIMSMQF